MIDSWFLKWVALCTWTSKLPFNEHDGTKLEATKSHLLKVSKHTRLFVYQHFPVKSATLLFASSALQTVLEENEGRKLSHLHVGVEWLHSLCIATSTEANFPPCFWFRMQFLSIVSTILNQPLMHTLKSKKHLQHLATLSRESSATTPAMECNFGFWPGSKLIFTTFRPSLAYFVWAEQVLGRYRETGWSM